MSLHWARVETRHGAFHVASRNGKIVNVTLPGQEITTLWSNLGRLFPGEEPAPGMDGVLADATVQIQEFTDGLRSEFSVPIELHGTDFQKQVWDQLMDIPYGETRSYGEIAAALGKPAASRAVGGANRANPVPLVVPCHRVIASDGGLGGYSGVWNEPDGLKAKLLATERSAPALEI